MITMRKINLLLLAVLAGYAPQLMAQKTAGNSTGAWYMYFGTTKISDRWSIHTEAQHRNYQVAANIDQLLLRAGLNYHYTNQHGQKSIITAGYAQIYSYPFEKSLKDSYSTEYRIWQQLITNSVLGKINLNHRYRLEQRWVERASETNYFNRARYRLMVTYPLFRKEEVTANDRHKITPGTTYLGVYDEVFINLEGSNNLAQNRLYFALGHKPSKSIDIQIGYLNQILGNYAFHRLQLGVFWNLDVTKAEEIIAE